jgi:hypothetical protein
MGAMENTHMHRTSSAGVSRLGRYPLLRLCAVVLILCAGGILIGSCASAPKHPTYPAPTTTVLPVGFADAFDAARGVLKDDQRLILHTVDKAGRFVAYERAGGFVFFRHRTILDLQLEPVGQAETKLTMSLKAEDYEMGGLTLPAGWYPSERVDTFLGEDIMGLIEKEARSRVQ